MLAKFTHTWLFGLIAVGSILTAAPVAHAQERSVTVVAILATDKNAEVDPKLKPIAEEVKKVEPSLTGFQLKRTTCKTLTLGKKDEFPLVEDATVSILLQETAGHNRIKVKVTAPKQKEIEYDCCCSKFFPIITRYQTKDGERLILAIMVKPKDK